ncbi:hypothetical protein RN001_000843 [Aquatica leii]|uniref:Uncharacterized protein n=1 Tax=Aquatica leii TaxID=1421715 RepID=A0AAN7Q7G9_9COLE|nr:hypothetical protein RN001_000843 [Aquatica leii]
MLFNITCRNVFINCAQNTVTDSKKAEPASNEKVMVHFNIKDEKIDQTQKQPKEKNQLAKSPKELIENNNLPAQPLKEVAGSKTNGDTIEAAVNKDKNHINSTTLASIPIRANFKNDLLQSGALLRGFYVFLGLSIITVFYFVYRSYRLRHGSQPSTTVKKYGITARRSDMEMRPLELDDEDDDTLFEVNTSTANR